MGWCPNCGAAGGKGKKHSQPREGGVVLQSCSRYSLSFAQAKKRFEPDWGLA
jgi:hypothetical protein